MTTTINPASTNARGLERGLSASSLPLGKRKKRSQPPLTSMRFGQIPAPIVLIRKLLRNPDELFEKDPNGYDKVMNNPIVQSEYTTLISPIVDSERSVQGYDPETDAKLSEMLSAMPNFEHMVEQALWAYVTGQRLIEMVWGRVVIDGEAFNMPVEFEPHDHQRFAYDVNGFLWMTQDGAFGSLPNRNNLTMTESGNPQFVHPFKMLRHTYRNGDGRWGYGLGEGRALYRLTEFMAATMEMWADFQQSYARPIKWLAIDENVLNEIVANGVDRDEYFDDEAEKLRNMIEDDVYVGDARNKLALVTPGPGQDALFDNLVKTLERFIKLHISGELMTSGDGDGKGSFALSKTHSRTQAGRRGRLVRGLCGTLSQQLLPPLIYYNQAKFPTISARARGRVLIHTPLMTVDEQREAAIASKLPILKDDAYRLIGVQRPSDEQEAAGETIVLGGGGSGQLVPSIADSPFGANLGL